VGALGYYQMKLLQDLKDWIYEQRVKHRRAQHKTEKVRITAAAEMGAPELLKLGV
jgi:hypothetical protein